MFFIGDYKIYNTLKNNACESAVFSIRIRSDYKSQSIVEKIILTSSIRIPPTVTEEKIKKYITFS